MSLSIFLTGLSCGMLLTAIGLTLWDSSREKPRFPRVVQIISWLTGVTLLVGALLSLPAYSPHLILMAALAAPLIPRDDNPPWTQAVLISPTLVLVIGALLGIANPAEQSVAQPPLTALELGLALCGGLSLRALGEVLQEVALQGSPLEWPSAAAYASLTLLVGGTTLTKLWRHGALWSNTVPQMQSILAGTWMVWSAAWSTPRQRRRLRAGLILGATSLLIWVMATCAR